MKDFKAKIEELWEVAEEYFTKELEKNLAQHRADERILRYKLKVYQKNFPNFICGNPTSTEVLDRDEEIKVGPNGIAHEEESQDFKGGIAKEGEIQPEIPQNLRGGVQEEK